MMASPSRGHSAIFSGPPGSGIGSSNSTAVGAVQICAGDIGVVGSAVLFDQRLGPCCRGHQFRGFVPGVIGREDAPDQGEREHDRDRGARCTWSIAASWRREGEPLTRASCDHLQSNRLASEVDFDAKRLQNIADTMSLAARPVDAHRRLRCGPKASAQRSSRPRIDIVM